MQLTPLQIPPAPRAIQKGFELKNILNETAIDCLGMMIHHVDSEFNVEKFKALATENLHSLSLMQRGRHIAIALRATLPTSYSEALAILLASMPAIKPFSEEFGLAEFFYLPHGCFISDYGLDPSLNKGDDPFEDSIQALYQLTQRFTAEFAIRDFLIVEQDRTLHILREWVKDSSPHVRRLCSEGSRPRLPWGKRLAAFEKDPSPCLPLLDTLKDDASLYVRRSVANHLGDIAKSDPERVFEICEHWLAAKKTKELCWLIRHALRYSAKKDIGRAQAIRKLAAFP